MVGTEPVLYEHAVFVLHTLETCSVSYLVVKHKLNTLYIDVSSGNDRQKLCVI